jgi:phosphoribosylglycinamide formyltransferase-1
MQKNTNKTMINLGVLVSGGGSNLQAIIDSCESGILKGLATVSVVIANRHDAFGLERAKKHGIPSVCYERREFVDATAFYAAITETLQQHDVDLVCLAGYLSKIEVNMLRAFPHRIINIHPALLPKFGGKGMYGHHVHEAVVAANELESGPTVHWVDEEYDNGDIILQERVPLSPGDTPETVARRVLVVEHQLYPRAILKIITDSSQFSVPSSQ